MADQSHKPMSALVAHNLRDLRRRRSMSTGMLVELLAERGVRIPLLGIRRAEVGERKFDIDELAAIAAVLCVPLERLWTEAPKCELCAGAPPSGFICGACGAGGARA